MRMFVRMIGEYNNCDLQNFRKGNIIFCLNRDNWLYFNFKYNK